MLTINDFLEVLTIPYSYPDTKVRSFIRKECIVEIVDSPEDVHILVQNTDRYIRVAESYNKVISRLFNQESNYANVHR